ncbi:ribonuclease toxin immunity protein CdiI [Bacillus sp. NPDC077411]|uniref:ribonuclease toxin immunity protein CdiI n=1 Tax=Bacillus sp. NPDC077411 TaxID=3363947 RepID=UPI0037C8F04F
MEDSIFYIEKYEDKIEEMKYYFLLIGDSKFLPAIRNFRESKGYGIANVCCSFATEFSEGEDGYFGKEGVNFSSFSAANDDETYAVVDNETFYRFLKETSLNYLTRHPEHENEVRNCIEKIKKNLSIT